MIIRPLNDRQCLGLMHAETRQYAQLPWVRALARQFNSLDEVEQYIRYMQQRDDLGHPGDGPRVPCKAPQRLRFAPGDPNCFERTSLYLALAEILDPAGTRTSASMVMDDGWHTFPVEIRNGMPEVVVLDPITPPRNAMLATTYHARNLIPGTENNLAPWFHSVARNACLEDGGDGGEACYQRAISGLRNAMLTAQPITEIDDLAHVLALAGDEAEIFGNAGRAAHDQVHRSIRNLSFKLDRNLVSGIVRKIVDAGEKLAPAALKAALVSQFGPAAAVALHGVDLAIENSAEGDGDGNAQTGGTEAGKNPEAKTPASAPKVGTLQLTLEDSQPTSAVKKAAPSSSSLTVGTLRLSLEGSSEAIRRRKPPRRRQSPKDQLRRMSLAFRHKPS